MEGHHTPHALLASTKPLPSPYPAAVQSADFLRPYSLLYFGRAIMHSNLLSSASPGFLSLHYRDREIAPPVGIRASFWQNRVTFLEW
jgi:hypothetical protein